MNNKRFELIPIDGRKSFYGKAIYLEKANGDVVLESYGQSVLRIRNGNLEKLWNGYSRTTMRHIRAFLSLYGLKIVGNSHTWRNNLPLCGF